LLNALQAWQRAAGLRALVQQHAQNLLQVKPAAIHVLAFEVIHLQNFSRHRGLGNQQHADTSGAHLTHAALQAFLPGCGIGFGHAGMVGGQHLAVCFGLQHLTAAQQQPPLRGPHIHRQRLVELHPFQRNRHIDQHQSTTTGTRCASAHISS